ncbi:MAG: ATP-grasp domain-containing protein [Candidatus Acidiferrales bacterium]
MSERATQRLLILASKLGYQTRSFAEAAQRLGIEVALGTDRCRRLEDPWGDRAIALAFKRPDEAATEITARAKETPFRAILALGDRATPAAARAAHLLGIPYNSVESVENCRSKLRQREVLAAAGLPVPRFFSFALGEPMEAAIARATFPCVLKPLRLAASQGVIRANDAAEFRAAAERIRALLATPEVQAVREPELDRVLVEEYVPGAEAALECLLESGRLRVLAIFDKPDPLEGPYFEETIYVTPSRLAASAQAALIECAERSARALGLSRGPLHAEFRWNERGPWVLELAPRPIGGLCAKALRFGEGKMPLEELLVRSALGLPGTGVEREREASGVMMIPVPQSGILESVGGEDAARAVPGVKEIEITARLKDRVTAWPEGSSYLGFIFARAGRPEDAESALRAAHARLRFVIREELPVKHPLSASARRG